MGREMEYVAEAVRNRHLHGDGPFTRRCHAWLEQKLGARALLTSSCTHALEMTALLLDIKPGDEVIVPAFTFVSSANAFVLRGATPVFVDSRPDTMNLDERQLERLVTKRTRAVVVVHYAGVGCEMDAVMALARECGVAVVEDNAHGLCGAYRGKPLGTFGAMATLSFHDTKNFSCGEGGALIINDPALVARAEIIREKGTNRSRFFRGEVDKYTWVDVGSSYLPSELQAAFLLGQFESEERIQARRKAIWNAYDDGLKDWCRRHGIVRPTIPAECQSSWHLYHLMLPSLTKRQDLIRHVRSRDAAAVFHYLPLHLSDFGRRLNPKPPSLPVAEAAGEKLLRLPMYNDMTDADVAEVIATVKEWPA